MSEEKYVSPWYYYMVTNDDGSINITNNRQNYIMAKYSDEGINCVIGDNYKNTNIPKGGYITRIRYKDYWDYVKEKRHANDKWVYSWEDDGWWSYWDGSGY